VARKIDIAAKRVLQRSALLRRIYLGMTFPVERQLQSGSYSNASQHPSIIHFSLNRAGTQYVKSILDRCGTANGMVPANLNRFAREAGLPYLDHLDADEMGPYRHMFRSRGYLYSAFSGFVESIPDLDQYRILVVVRDPRDVLTSRYYSNAFGHGLPADPGRAEGFDRRRSAALAITVDEFALRNEKALGDVYREYGERLMGQPNVWVSRYEDVVLDFSEWLDGMLRFTDLAIDATLRSTLELEAASSTPRAENKARHARQVLPGDHRRKLTPATIERLNSTLADVLDRYGYASRAHSA
jgi:hypothetical protein